MPGITGLPGVRTMIRQGAMLNLKDTNADAFILASGITDATQKKAITQFVIDLKKINAVQSDFVNFDTPSNSICQAIYLFVGGVASKHKFNLINPVDSDAAFRLTYNTGITHNEQGVHGNKVTGGISTHLSSALLQSDSHGIDVMGTGEPDSANYWLIMNGGAPYVYITTTKTAANPGPIIGTSKDQQITPTRKNEFSSSGLYSVNRISNAIGGMEYYNSGIKLVSTAAVSNAIQVSDFGILSTGAYGFKSESGVQFASIRKTGVPESVIILYQKAILNLQNTLGRLPKKNIVFEGHSFFNNQPPSAVNWLDVKTIYKLNSVYANRIYRYVSSAIGGSTLDQMIARKATAVNPYKLTDFGMKNIIPICIGTNDANNTVGNGTVMYNKLKSYYDSVVADGWIPIILTMTPKLGGTGTMESERIIFNNLIRNDMHPTYLVDTDLIPQLLDSTNTAYFLADQVHLTGASNDILSDIMVAMIVGM